MEAMELRRLVGDAMISRAYAEEALAIEIVAKDPARLMGALKQMHAAKKDPEKKRIFNALTRDEQLAFVFLAQDPKAPEKVRDYLHRR